MATLSQTPFGADRTAGAGEPSAGLTAFEAEIVAVFADLVVLLGMPKSMGEIYGLLFASAEPLTFAEIEQKLGLSKGSVSQGLRSLRDLGAVIEAGDTEGTGRTTHWLATTELRKLIGNLLREKLTPYLERQDKRMKAAESALAEEADKLTRARVAILENRLGKLQTWQSRAGTVLPVIGKML